MGDRDGDASQIRGASDRTRAATAGTAAGRGRCGGDPPDGGLDQQRERRAALGNLDVHAKNISLLHPPPRADGTPEPARLAPAYDMVPMLHQPNDGRVAMAINGEFAHARIAGADLVAEGESWGVAGADAVVAATLAEIADFLTADAPAPGAFPRLQDDIATVVDRLHAA